VKYDPTTYTANTPSTTSTSSYPFVPTEVRTVGNPAARDEYVANPPMVTTIMEQGEVVTSQSITSKTRTVETVTVNQKKILLLTKKNLFYTLMLSEHSFIKIFFY